MDPKVKKLLHQGETLLRRGNAADAVHCLETALTQSPDSPRILEPLATAYRENGQYIPALKTYDHIIGLNAATATTWLATGNALSDRGEYAQAIGAFEKSLEMDQANPETHHNLARACYRMGQVSRAGTRLESALRHGDAINTWQGLAALLPGWPEADHGKLIRCRQQFARKLAEYTVTIWPSESDRPPPGSHKGPLRIGYACAFFHKKNFTKPVWGLINYHDRSKFQISLISDSPPDGGFPCYVPMRKTRFTMSGSWTIIFGSLVTQYKITPQVMDAWCEILRGVPDSHLILANRTLKSPNNRIYVLDQFVRRGIDSERIELHGPSDHATYLRHYDRIDVALDSFPYNGGTTTMEAMWQGVPVIINKAINN